jgi:hypothetical protein
MTTAYESVISDDQLAELSLLVTSKGFTLAAACEELCEDVIDAESDEATATMNELDDAAEQESFLGEHEAAAAAINNQGFEEQIRYLYDAFDFNILKTRVLEVVANLESKRV